MVSRRSVAAAAVELGIAVAAVACTAPEVGGATASQLAPPPPERSSAPGASSTAPPPPSAASSTAPPPPSASTSPACAVAFTQQQATASGDRYRFSLTSTNAATCGYVLDDPAGASTPLPSCNYTFDGGITDLGGPGQHTVYVSAAGAGASVGRCSVPLTIPCQLTVTPTGAGGVTDTFSASLTAISSATGCAVSIDGAAPKPLGSCSAPPTTFTGADLGGSGTHTLAVSVDDAKGNVGACHAVYVIK